MVDHLAASNAYVNGSASDTSDPSSADPTLNTDYSGPFGYSAQDSQRLVPLGGSQMSVPTPGVTTPKPLPGPGNGATKDTWDNVFLGYRTMFQMDPNGFKLLQAKLYAAGFYDGLLKKGQTPAFGRFDANTVKAVNKAIGEAVVTGNSVDDVLDSAGATGDGTQQTTQLPSPDIIKANAQQTAANVIGHRLDDSTLNQITSDANNLATQQGASPDASWIAEEIRKLNPNATQAFQTSGNVGNFLKMIDGQGLWNAYHS